MTIGTKQIAIVVGIVILFFVGWFVLRANRPQTVLNLDSKGTSIVAFGDSLVEGVGSTNGHDFVSLLSARIGSPIINLGHSGDTTADALARIAGVFEHDPRVVIVLLGGNDYLKGVPMDNTFANLDRIVTAIQSRGAAVLLLGVRGGLLHDTYNSRFESFARDHETAFVPNILDGLLGDSKLMSDEIHPNDAGYVKVADKVLPVLESMLNKSN